MGVGSPLSLFGLAARDVSAALTHAAAKPPPHSPPARRAKAVQGGREPHRAYPTPHPSKPPLPATTHPVRPPYARAGTTCSSCSRLASATWRCWCGRAPTWRRRRRRAARTGGRTSGTAERRAAESQVGWGALRPGWLAVRRQVEGAEDGRRGRGPCEQRGQWHSRGLSAWLPGLAPKSALQLRHAPISYLWDERDPRDLSHLRS